MSTTIKTFTFPVHIGYDATIRIINQNGKPWIVAKDVCNILGLSNTALALRPLEATEKSYVNRINFGLAPGRPMVIINKQGLQRLLMRSDKPVARRFQDWLLYEVLPSIEENGGYIAGQELVRTGEMTDMELLAKSALVAQRVLEQMTKERDALLAENKKLAPKAQKYSDFLDTDGLTNLTGAAKAMNMTAIALGRRLREIGWLNKKANGVIPNDPIVKKGYMRTRIVPVSETKTVVQGRFTSEGLDALFNLFNVRAA